MKLIRVKKNDKKVIKKKDSFDTVLDIVANGLIWNYDGPRVTTYYKMNDKRGEWKIYGDSNFEGVHLVPLDKSFMKYYDKAYVLTKDRAQQALQKAQQANDQNAADYFSDILKQFAKIEKSVASIKKLYSRGYISL